MSDTAPGYQEFRNRPPRLNALYFVRRGGDRNGGLETNTRKIIARLEREGRKNVGGKKHAKFRHPGRRETIMVPRHATVAPLVARSIEGRWLARMRIEESEHLRRLG